MIIDELWPSVSSGLSATARERVAHASNWDLSDVAARVQRRLGWTDAQAHEAIGEYRKFIVLISLHPDEEYGMSEDVDEVWHQHILDTQDYAAMCEATAGGMIHHIQSPLDGTQQSSALATIQALSRLFCGPVSALWQGRSHSVAKCCSHVVAHA